MSEWYAYDWELQGLPAKFRVDLSYAEEFDALGDFTTLLYLSCYSKNPSAAAFTARENRILEGVCRDALKILGSKSVFVGSIDVGAQRRYYFYTSDARLLVPMLALCADETSLRLECLKADEPNRQTYYRLLVPDAAKRQSVDNERYVRALRERGDDNAAYRRVNLHFYLPSATSRTLFAEAVKAQGFAIGADDYIPERELPYYLVLHAVSPLEKQALTGLTTKAIYTAETYGGLLEHLDAAFIPRRGLLG